MAELSFKNVGIKGFKQEDVLNRNKTLVPIGIKTPVEPDPSENGIFLMHTDIRNQIDDNLRNLILTNWGERLGNYYFGANLRPILVDFSHKEDFDQEAMLRINTAIAKFLPFVTPVAYESFIDRTENGSTGIVRLMLIYSINSLNITNAKMQVSLFVI